jgi:DNA-binding transcriptional regulator YdaS (Cro superfamily)
LHFVGSMATILDMTLNDYLSERGATARLAHEIGVSHAAVRQWADSRVPAERVLDVERVTGVSRHTLRPDVFGPAPDRESDLRAVARA